jgi:hypothetical protein
MVISCLWGQADDPVVFRRVELSEFFVDGIIIPGAITLELGEYMIVAGRDVIDRDLCEVDHGFDCEYDCDCDDPTECDHECETDGCEPNECDCADELVTKTVFYAMTATTIADGVTGLGVNGLTATVVDVENDKITDPEEEWVFKVIETGTPPLLRLQAFNDEYVTGVGVTNHELNLRLDDVALTRLNPSIDNEDRLVLGFTNNPGLRTISLAIHSNVDDRVAFLHAPYSATRLPVSLFKLVVPDESCEHDFEFTNLTPARDILFEPETYVEVEIEFNSRADIEYEVELVVLVAGDDTEQIIEMEFDVTDDVWRAVDYIDLPDDGFNQIVYFIRVTHLDDDCEEEPFDSRDTDTSEEFLFGEIDIRNIRDFDNDAFTFEGFTVQLTGIATTEASLQNDEWGIKFKEESGFELEIGIEYTVIGELTVASGMLVLFVEGGDDFIEEIGPATVPDPKPFEFAELLDIEDIREFCNTLVSVEFVVKSIDPDGSMVTFEDDNDNLFKFYISELEWLDDIDPGDTIKIVGILEVLFDDALIVVTKEIEVTEKGDPLSVELYRFLATVTQDGAVNLEWITASETNMRGFIVYRSDNENFTDRVRLNQDIIPARNTSVFQTYSIIDTDVISKNTYFYIIEMHHTDLTMTLSPMRSVFVDIEVLPPTLFTSFRNVYPNPMRNEANLQLFVKTGETATLRVFNVRGQMVKEFKLNEGDSSFTWDLKDTQGRDVAGGLYFFRLASPTTQEVRRTMIVR